jgi:hypothetical protein
MHLTSSSCAGHVDIIKSIGGGGAGKDGREKKKHHQKFTTCTYKELSVRRGFFSVKRAKEIIMITGGKKTTLVKIYDRPLFSVV